LAGPFDGAADRARSRSGAGHRRISHRPPDREPFLEALARLEHERRRDGAYAWGVFEDAAQEGRIIETFLIESWMEHLRQHERVTKADRLIQEELRRFDRSGIPKVTHFIAADT
jgi:hypothetical protein